MHQETLGEVWDSQGGTGRVVGPSERSGTERETLGDPTRTSRMANRPLPDF